MAPDVLMKKYSFEADVWSCGVILYLLICGTSYSHLFCLVELLHDAGEPPFYGKSREEVAKSILFWDVDFSFEPWPSVSPSLKKCIMWMLERYSDLQAPLPYMESQGNRRSVQQQGIYCFVTGWLNNMRPHDNRFPMPFIQSFNSSHSTICSRGWILA